LGWGPLQPITGQDITDPVGKPQGVEHSDIPPILEPGDDGVFDPVLGIERNRVVSRQSLPRTRQSGS
jgi:hypothetical protein